MISAWRVIKGLLAAWFAVVVFAFLSTGLLLLLFSSPSVFPELVQSTGSETADAIDFLAAVGSVGALIASVIGAFCFLLLFYPVYLVCNSNRLLKSPHCLVAGISLGVVLALAWLLFRNGYQSTPNVYLALESTILIVGGAIAGLAFYFGSGLSNSAAVPSSSSNA